MLLRELAKTGDFSLPLVPFSAPVLDTSPIASATTITISGSVPSGSVVAGVVVEWQRDTSVGCPGTDKGSAFVSGAFSTYTIAGTRGRQ